MKYIANPVEVDAYRIGLVCPEDVSQTVGHVTVFLDERFRGSNAILLTPAMTAWCWPQVGDYYVVQADGYTYINPADVFERKYSAKICLENSRPRFEEDRPTA